MKAWGSTKSPISVSIAPRGTAQPSPGPTTTLRSTKDFMRSSDATKGAKILLPVLLLWPWKQAIQLSPRTTVFKQSKVKKVLKRMKKQNNMLKNG